MMLAPYITGKRKQATEKQNMNSTEQELNRARLINAWRQFATTQPSSVFMAGVHIIDEGNPDGDYSSPLNFPVVLKEAIERVNTVAPTTVEQELGLAYVEWQEKMKRFDARIKEIRNLREMTTKAYIQSADMIARKYE